MVDGLQHQCTHEEQNAYSTTVTNNYFVCAYPSPNFMASSDGSLSLSSNGRDSRWWRAFLSLISATTSGMVQKF